MAHVPEIKPGVFVAGSIGKATEYSSAPEKWPEPHSLVVYSHGEVAKVPLKMDKVSVARMSGYTGDCCGNCSSFTMVRNGTCLKCETCGETTGCS